ncbi:MAG: hypothetical protein AAGF98_00885 [Cyanobacteria bacterium P01_H01_bin.153]
MTENNFTLVNLETTVCADSSVKQMMHALPEKDLKKIRGGFPSLPVHPIMEDPCALAIPVPIYKFIDGKFVNVNPCGER